jgi:hypothetical protein
MVCVCAITRARQWLLVQWCWAGVAMSDGFVSGCNSQAFLKAHGPCQPKGCGQGLGCMYCLGVQLVYSCEETLRVVLAP